MERAPWGILLVLLVSPGGTSLKEHPSQLCYTWIPQFAIFWCPEEHGQPNATFCCGTCQQTYCCASEEDHLDQRLCRQYSRPAQTHIPRDWYYLLFFMGVLTLVCSYICSTIFTKSIESLLGERRSCCGCERSREIQLVEMVSQSTFSLSDAQPTSTHVNSGNVSLGAEDLTGSEVLPPAWDESDGSEYLAPSREVTSTQVHHVSDRMLENEAIAMFPAALLDKSVSCPILEAPVEGEDVSVSRQ